MDKTIRTLSIITLALLMAAGFFLVRGYTLQSGDAASIGALLVGGTFAPLLIALVMCMTNSRKNGQQGWFWCLLALLIVGVLGPFVAYSVLASLAEADLTGQYGLLLLTLYLTLPGLAALGTLIYSRSAEPFMSRTGQLTINTWDKQQD